MRKIVDKAMEDLSTKEAFLFRITCAACAAQHNSKPKRFSKAEIVPATPNKKIIYDALYEQEHGTAMQTAARELAEHMNYCPICKKLVCNQCFLICDDLDMCRHCAEALNEKGKPVLSNVVEPAV